MKIWNYGYMVVNTKLDNCLKAYIKANKSWLLESNY